MRLDDFEIGTISTEDQTRGIVSGTLAKMLKPQNIQHKFQIENMADEIVSKIYEKDTCLDKFNRTINNFHHHQMWYFSIVSGYASLWEMHL